MPEPQITPVTNKNELEEFITFPWKVYKDDPNWVPHLLSQRREAVDTEKNPFFDRAKATFFLARRDGEAVGTIVAFSNYLYNEIHQDNSGFFGFFEVFDGPETATALLKAAEGWTREAGHDQILGPMQYSTNDELSLLVDGFDDSPRVLMTYNPPRYQGYIEDAGYEKAMDLWAYKLVTEKLFDDMPAKIERVGKKILKRRNLTVRTLDMKRWDEEVAHVRNLYNATWEANWGFVPITDREWEDAAKHYKPLVDPDFVLLVEKEGEVVGFALAFPDLYEPMRLAYPKSGMPETITILRLLWHWKVRRVGKWVRVLLLGTLPEYRGLGLEALLYIQLVKTANEKGYLFGEGSWMLEDNDMMNRGAGSLGGEVYKTYRIYQKAL